MKTYDSKFNEIILKFAGVDGRLPCEKEVHLIESYTNSTSVLQILVYFKS